MKTNEPTDVFQIDDLCDRFEKQWHSGSGPPEIERFLADAEESQRLQLLEFLIPLDIEYRRRSGLDCSDEFYYAQFPEYSSSIEHVLATIRQETSLTTQHLDPSTINSNRHDVADLCGTQIGPYNLLTLIGAGGMGLVFLAEQTEGIKRQVAIKLIRTNTPTDEVLARFEMERQAIALMNHPNIAKVFEAGLTTDGRPYFAMELVNGIAITKYCDENSLPLDDRLELFIQVCRAIQHAHTKGVIHRDIKPSNVLVTKVDGETMVKVIDFGMAKAVHDQTQLTDHSLRTQFGQVMGTLAYMSPEQAGESANDLDTRTDVYSLGVLFYELLTSTTPVTRESINTQPLDRVLLRIRTEEPTRPSLHLMKFPGQSIAVAKKRQTTSRRLIAMFRRELDWVVVKALEKNRNRRYETVAELADDIECFRNDESIKARPPNLTYRIRKGFSRNKGKLLSASLALVLLIVGITGTSTGWYNASKAKANIIKERDRANHLLARAFVSKAVALEEKGRYQQAIPYLAMAYDADPEFSRIPLFAAESQIPEIEFIRSHGRRLNYAIWDSRERRIATAAQSGQVDVIDIETNNTITWNAPERAFQLEFSNDEELFGGMPVRLDCSFIRESIINTRKISPKATGRNPTRFLLQGWNRWRTYNR